MNQRLRLAAVALGVTAAAAVSSPAYAVGTGGVELTPLQGNQAASAFHVHLAPGHQTTQRFLLRNGSAKPAQFQLYAAAVYPTKVGGFTVDGPGTAPWIGLPTKTLTLAANQTQTLTFKVRRTSAQHGAVAYGAVVLAIADHQVVSRAAAMVYLERPGKDPVSRAVLPLVIAAMVAAAAVAAQLVVRRRRAGVIRG